ncbi:enoyl-CoA hydratase/isomerase family protein [Agromyces sp. SYSU T00194]|uniref:enoyl-CoA hydratase/isomerase family protein n=1 Tax=Agromyces chitinivorans TaxID=3158560 RepID=UPI00339B3887
MSADPILLEVDGAVATVTLNRPERRNALDAHARLALVEAFAAVDADDAVRVVVLTGAGTAFCAGTDLRGGPVPPELATRPLAEPVATCTRPVVAAVNGPAAGGGFELALAADLRLCSSAATFLLPELRIGSLPGSGGTQRVFGALPAAIAAHLLYTGLPLDAEAAGRWGLVSEVVEPEELGERARALAGRVAEAAPLSLRAAKRAARAASEHADGFALERALWAELAETRDRAEGRAAFRERRPPAFEGR